MWPESVDVLISNILVKESLGKFKTLYEVLIITKQHAQVMVVFVQSEMSNLAWPTKWSVKLRKYNDKDNPWEVKEA